MIRKLPLLIYFLALGTALYARSTEKNVSENTKIDFYKSTLVTENTTTVPLLNKTGISRLSAVVAVNPPSAVSLQIYAGAGTIANLTATGTDLKWYANKIGGSPLAATTALVNDAFYYVSQTVSGVESSRTQVKVRKVSEATQSLACSATVANLTSTPSLDSQISWYTTESGGTALDPTTRLKAGTYYVEQNRLGTSKKIIENNDNEISYRLKAKTDGSFLVIQHSSPNFLILNYLSDGTFDKNFTPINDDVTSLAFTKTGKILSVSRNGIIQRDADGSNPITLNSTLENGSAIAIQSDGKILVIDHINKTLIRLNQDGTNPIVLATNIESFYGWNDIAVDSQDNIYVSYNKTLLKFGPDGSNRTIIATNLSSPHFGIQDDGKLVVYINGYVQRMDPDGTNLTILFSALSFDVFPGSNDTFLKENIVYYSTSISIYTSASTSNRVAVQVTLPIVAQPTAVTSQIYAGNGTVAHLTATGTDLKWYDTTRGGTAFPSTTALVDGFTYQVSQTVSGCESSRTAVRVRKISEAKQTFSCAITVAQLVATPRNGGYVRWYKTPTGGTLMNNSDPISSGTYYVEQVSNSIVSNRVAIEIVVNETTKSTALSPQIYAGVGTIANLTATGTNLKWFTAATGGTALSTTTTLEDGATYYVSQSENSCESSRTAVVAKKISEASQLFCEEITPISSTTTPSSNATVSWFTTPSGGTPMNEFIDPMPSETYYVEQSIPAQDVSIGTGLTLANDVAVQIDGKILVADTFNNSIKRMDKDGSNIATIGSGFNKPLGVAIDSNGKILVVDDGAIKRMNVDGSNIETLVSLTAPTGVAVQLDGKIVFVDFQNKAVKRMDPDGSNIETLSTNFTGPWGVAVQLDGKIIVADRDAKTIKRMDANGTNMITLASGFSAPVDIIIENDGKILVADNGSSEIKRMNNDGTGIVTLGSGFFAPSGIAIEANGNILVADTNNNTIKRMNPSGKLLKTGDGINNVQISEPYISNRVAVTINTSNAAPNLTAQSVCGGTTLGNIFPKGGDLRWYTVASGGSALNATDVVTASTYYVSQILTAGCPESPRTPVVITISSTTTPPAVADSQSVCAEATVADLMATGTDIKWYESLTSPSFNALSPKTNLASGTYYVSQTMNGCESTRVAVNVTVNAKTPDLSDAFHIFYDIEGTMKVGDLLTTYPSGTDLKIYLSKEGGLPIAHETSMKDVPDYYFNPFYVTQTINGCESNRSTISTHPYSPPTMADNSPATVEYVINNIKKALDLKENVQINLFKNVPGDLSSDYLIETSTTLKLQLVISLLTGKQNSSDKLQNNTITSNTIEFTFIIEKDPTDITLSANEIDENSAPNTSVGTLTTTDPNAGNTFTYSLVSGFGDVDNTSFTIDGNSLKMNNSPDFESNAIYNVRVRTTDQSGLYYEKVMTIYVKNVCDLSKVVSENDGILTATENAFQYQWYNCADNTVVGTNTKLFKPTSVGSYKVTIVSGSCTITSDCIPVTALGTDEFETKNQFLIYPNPSTGTININTDSDGEFYIFNQLGQTVQKFKVNANSTNSIAIDQLTDGVYFVKDSQSNRTNKLIIKK